jgi:hypothetical protein
MNLQAIWTMEVLRLEAEGWLARKLPHNVIRAAACPGRG